MDLETSATVQENVYVRLQSNSGAEMVGVVGFVYVPTKKL